MESSFTFLFFSFKTCLLCWTCCFKLSRSSTNAPLRMSAPFSCRFSLSNSFTRPSAFSHFCFVSSTFNSICFNLCNTLLSSSRCVTDSTFCELYRFSMSRISCLVSSTFLLAASILCSRTSLSLFKKLHCASNSETYM